MVMEEARVLDGLSNNYTKAWKELLKWRGISQAELSRRTMITEKTIGNIINGETIGTLNNDDHNWYRFVLKHMYPKSIPKIQSFLQEQGASPL